MRVFEFESYKDFVQTRIRSMPHAGRGQYREIARQLRMHTSLISQVFGGNRDLSLEQACDLCTYWGLNTLETEMFLALVQLERAGSKNLQMVIEKQIQQIRKRTDKFSYRLPQEKRLTDETRATFYSNWYYSGVRLITSIPQFRTVDAIAERFSLPRQLISNVVQFLLAHDLCIEDKNGQIRMGPNRIHVSADSPLVTRHHLNWRTKSLARAEHIQDHEVMFTAPLSISKKDAEKVKKKILSFVEEVSSIVKETNPEKVVCLNIDWLDF